MDIQRKNQHTPCITKIGEINKLKHRAKKGGLDA